MEWTWRVLAAAACWFALLGHPSLLNAQAPAQLRLVENRQDVGNLMRATLRNGLILLVEEQPAYPLVSVVTWIQAEGDSKVGDQEDLSVLLCRLLEESEAAARSRQLGAQWKCALGPGWMAVSVTGPSENFARLLEIQAELFAPIEFEGRNLAWANEALVSRNSAQNLSRRDMAKRHLAALLVPESQPLPSKTEWEIRLDSIDVRSLEGFHRARFIPQKAIVTVSGAVLKERVLEAVSSGLGRVARAEIGRPQAVTLPASSASTQSPSQGGLRYGQVRSETGETYVLWGARIPDSTHEDHLALRAVAALLAAGPESFLARDLIFDEPAAYEVERFFQPVAGGEIMGFILTPHSGQIERVEVAFLAFLEVLRNLTLQAEELNPVKAVLLREHYARLQTLEGRANQLAQSEARGDFRRRDGYLERLADLTGRDLQRVVQRHLGPSQWALLEYLSRSEGPRTFTAESIEGFFQLLVPPVAKAYSDEILTRRVLLSGGVFDFPRAEPRYQRWDWVQTSVLRGPDIYLQQDFSLPLVHLGIFYPGGRNDESRADAGITEVSLRALLADRGGSEGRKAFELAACGGEIEVINEPGFFGFRTTLLAPCFAPAFEGLVQKLREPHLQPDSVRIAQRHVAHLAEEEASHARSAAVLQLRSHLFGDHPESRSRYGTSQSVAQLVPEQVQTWLSSHLFQTHPIIVIRGALEGTTFLQSFIPLLSQSEFTTRRLRRSPVARGGLETAVAKGGIRQSRENHIWVAYPGPSLGGLDDNAAEIFLGLMNGSAGWLDANLRENLGLVAEARFERLASMNGGAMIFEALAEPHRHKEVQEELNRLLTRFHRYGPQRQEFMQALVFSISQVYAQSQEADEDVLRVVRRLATGRRLDPDENLASSFREVNRDEVMDLAVRYFPIVEPARPSSP